MQQNNVQFLPEASFTRQRFSRKEHRFMLVFNVRLHGDSENDHKNANRLQSEAFQKRIGNCLRVNAKNGKMVLVIANSHVTIAFSCRFCGVYMNGVQRRKVIKILTTYRDHALLHFVWDRD